MIDTPCESNIYTAVEEHFSSENTRHSGIAANLQWLSTINMFSKRQIIEVAKEVVFPEVSKLNDSVTNKNHRD